MKSTLDLYAIGASIQARLGRSPWIPKDAKLTVSPAKEGRNPHVFDVSIGNASIIGSVRVRVELWRAPAPALLPLAVEVRPVRLLSGPAAGAQAFVPSATLREIYVDKVFALAARPYLKARDVFDLYWLASQVNMHWLASQVNLADTLICSPADLEVRLATYPSQTPQNWLTQAAKRRTELPTQIASIQRDLARWLPSTWALQEAQVEAMVQTSMLALDGGISSMHALATARQAQAAVPVKRPRR